MSFIIFVLAIAGVVWGAVLAMRGSPILGCVIYLIVASCFSGYFWSIDAAGLTWSIDRFFMMLLLITIVVQWRLGKCDIKSLSPADLALGGFMLLLIVRTFTSDWRDPGPDQEPILMHLVNGYGIPLAILLIARHAKLNETKLKAAYAALACFGVYLVITALAEGTHAWAFVVPKYITDPELGTHFGRARGPMLQSARMGTYLIVCAAVTVGLFAWRGKWTRQAVVLGGLLLPCYLGAVYFTYTRSVWLGLGIAAMVALMVTLNNRWRTLALTGALGAAAVLVVAKGDNFMAFQRDTSASDTAESTYMRVSFAYVSWLMFQERPIAGFGFGQYPKESIHYLGDRSTNIRLESIRGYIHHNTLLSVLVELGIFGLLLMLAFYFLWARQAWQLWQADTLPFWVRAHGLLFLAVVAPYFLQMLFHEVSYSTVENGIMFFLAGTTGSLHAAYITSGRTSAYGRWEFFNTRAAH